MNDKALEIASRLGHIYSDNYADGLVETAKLYEKMTGKDMGIKDLQRTADEVNGRTPWYRKLFRIIKKKLG